MSRAQRGQVRRLGAHDRDPADVRLQLQQRGVGGRAAVCGQDAGAARGLAYRHQQVVDLEGYGLQRGARHVLQACPQRQAGQQAGGRRIPPGRAQPVETRDEVHSVCSRLRRDRR